ncbi:unnamed protein product [Allacma fusca]|uniref:A20-type domain-containing protein n=1 Tax=Allacma fusca TaxID=39272 RepID=A0A8J2PTY1_9HEXA|nr:unnamed protein product [Allacma fusca]
MSFSNNYGVNQQYSKLKISQQDLLCRNGCGHYGNTAQEGFCSVCFKLYKQSQVVQPPPRDEAPSVFDFGRAGISGFATLPRAAAAKL